MLPETNIDYQKSMISGRLIIRPRWLERMEQFGLPLFCLIGMRYALMLWKGLDFKDNNEAFIGYVILPIVIIVLAIIFYKKLQETKLRQINTGFGKSDNRRVVETFLKQEGYKTVRNNEDFIIAVTDTGFTSYPYQINILFADGYICICVLRLNSKARLPSLFEARSIRKDLERFTDGFKP